MLIARWGPAERAVTKALEEARSAGVANRIRARDPSLWSADPAVQGSISNRMGWIDAPSWASERLGELQSFAEEAKAFSPFALLGMGGSSLAPEVLSRSFAASDLIVLDSTDPSELMAAESRLARGNALFFVASKSGETIETRSHAAYFLERAGDASRFVAITDPGSPLEKRARDAGYRRVFGNPPDVGGRYSALTYFGLVPAAAIGLDLEPVITSAAHASDDDAVSLGVALGELALRGRDKVTFVAPEGFASFGAWAEQLLAESTGKDGTGLIPIDGEPLGAPDLYNDDRIFVSLGTDAALDALAGAGHPVVEIPATEPADLGALFFSFELATAAVGWRLGVNPFDEPNVSESKQNTARLIEAFEKGDPLPSSAPAAVEEGVQLYGAAPAASVAEGLRAFFGSGRAGDYVALLAFVPRDPPNEETLRGIRTTIRDRLRLATTAGFGPRYLHSTGQLHKGGPSTGLFLQITAGHREDVLIPGRHFTFGVLQAAQAAGDFDSLVRHGRRVIRVHLIDGVERGLPALRELVEKALT